VERTGQGRANEVTAPQVQAAASSGAAAAAGVLTAIDEDEEGAEEAPVPDEFEYFSEKEGQPDEE
jgi:26S proteasome regulatory subunit N2